MGDDAWAGSTQPASADPARRPGSPYTPFNSWLGAWEREFTIIQWDQRGSGKTFIRAESVDSGGPPAQERLTLERLVADGFELAELIHARFGRPPILVGSSIGSLIGAIMAKRRPDLFAAYVASNVFAKDTSMQSHAITRQRAEAVGNTKTVAALDAIGPDPTRWTPEQSQQISKLAIKATTGAPDMVYDLMLPALMYAPDLTMADIRAIDRGMKTSPPALQPEYSQFNMDTLGYEYSLPYLIVQGAQEIVSPLGAARAHFERITAPSKDFSEVPAAGHLVEFANRKSFLNALRKAAAS